MGMGKIVVWRKHIWKWRTQYRELEISKETLRASFGDLNLGRQKLDEKHYGLTKSKEKVVQYLVAQQQVGKPLGKVLLLTGLAGVGKSSFAASVAEAVGRKFGYVPLERG
ncbi:22734_t:CDS:2 [Gigaspora rosea]|nr:22734_t:CDS:2 [Gigaspora rosea]